MRNPFKNLSSFEWILWMVSLCAVITSFVIPTNRDLLSFIGSLIGVTALIFVSKGDVTGQMLTVMFAVFYSIVSMSRTYYGEMITYMFMTAPMAICAVIEWIRHPYKGNKAEVEVKHLSRIETAVMFAASAVVTFIFYFILKYFNTAELLLSTVSITTSFLASYLTYRRSPYYALAYAANDIVLIGLWIMAGNISMIICFAMFFANDMYGFFNWKRIGKRQSGT